jgi:hypothetical protein
MRKKTAIANGEYDQHPDLKELGNSTSAGRVLAASGQATLKEADSTCLFLLRD